MTAQTHLEPPPYETNLLDPQNLRFHHSPTNVLRLSVVGTICYLRVKVLRTFPLSDGNTFISVRNALDNRAREIGLVANVAELDPESAQAVIRELTRHYFVPQITAIKSVKNEFGFFYWEVDTDRGPRTFPMYNSHDNVIEVSERRIVLTDAYGARFEIADLDALDKKSRELVRKTIYL